MAKTLTLPRSHRGDIDPDDPKLNTSLVRGLSLLQAFREGEVYLGTMDLARRTGIPKATVSRMAYTLYKLGYLSYSPDIEKYSISPGVLDLAYSVFMRHDIHILARPLMQNVAAATQSTVGLSVRDGLSMVFLDYAMTRDAALTQDLAIGFRVPIHTSAMGYACLAAMRRPEREQTMQQLLSALKRNERSGVQARIEQGLKEYAERGFCISQGDVNEQSNAVGVPFATQRGSQIYALNAVAPKFQFTEKRMLTEIGPQLLQIVEDLRRGEPQRHAAPAGKSKGRMATENSL